MTHSNNPFENNQDIGDPASNQQSDFSGPLTSPATGDGVLVDPSVGFDSVTAYSIDGSGNNPTDPTLGAANTDEVRLAPANFAPGTTDTPVDGPNPRDISNAIFANDANATDPGGRSAYMYALGQFVDHDIDLNNDQTPAADGSNTLSFTIPDDDPSLPPGSQISITRGQVDPSNGAAVNSVTQYLDLSQVYWSDPTTAANLRNSDGTLKTSTGDYLPIVDGQYYGGDVRAAENPDLTSLDVLFVREHNYWVAQLRAEDPSLTGDQLYSMARAITTAEYQNIVYTEFLPHLLGDNALTPYQGYNSSVSPQIFEEFSTAAYRFGHSIVSPTETKIANDGTVLEQQDLVAASAEPTSSYQINGGADALLRNLAQDYSQQEGATINSDLRNMLNANPPGDVGDLAAIDILRERDLGIATLNQTREALGMTPYTSFDQITSDPTLASELQQVYGSVDQVDLFVGGLAENPAGGGSMVGPTFQAIIAQQFENLRDGDPSFYLNQGFSPQLMTQIQNTTLSDLIVRDAGTTAMQPDAFIATERHSSDVASPNPQAPQLVIGIDADNAVIAGSPGVDNTIVAGLGANQQLSGGGSSDTFVFLGSGHQDTVTDFNPATDKLDFENTMTAMDFSNVDLSAAPDGSAVLRANGNTIQLTGIAESQVSAGMVEFNQQNPALLAQQMMSAQS
ncbi:MAG TPA: peroxidase family protein [Acetobacteraceae bacterium]|nr:peroxidase family protein [Acetobacteraceae bacterium]